MKADQPTYWKMRNALRDAACQAFTSLDMGYAAAMSYVFFLIMFGLTIVQLRILRPTTDA